MLDIYDKLKKKFSFIAKIANGLNGKFSVRRIRPTWHMLIYGVLVITERIVQKKRSDTMSVRWQSVV